LSTGGFLKISGLKALVLQLSDNSGKINVLNFSERGGQMYASISAFFSKEQVLIPLFQTFADSVVSIIPECKIVIQKSQLALQDKITFCSVWLPIRAGIKGRPDHYFIVTFGLDKLLNSPRITGPVEPYPNRWTHHVIISKPDDIDTQLLDWIREAHRFKNGK
jgi:hypothetical protein